MTSLLCIKARLPRPAGLELCARLLAERPYWDIELDDDGLSFAIPLLYGRVDEELTVLEECCRNVERTRGALEIELEVKAGQEAPSFPPPGALGPWRLALAASAEPAWPPRAESGPAGMRQSPFLPDNFKIAIPPAFSFSRRQWAGEALLLTALADHLAPPPGAPATSGQAALIIESILPLAPLAAHQAGAGPISLITDGHSAPTLAELTGLNQIEAEIECLTLPFKSLARREDWRRRFGLIAVNISPYTSARRLKSLAGWLRPEGAIIIAGFAPGPQTAQILRSAARAGLELASSINDGDWAAMILHLAPPREELPPLTGSVVPALVDLPPEEIRMPAQDAAEGFSTEGQDGEEEAFDDESLMVEEVAEDE